MTELIMERAPANPRRSRDQLLSSASRVIDVANHNGFEMGEVTRSVPPLAKAESTGLK